MTRKQMLARILLSEWMVVPLLLILTISCLFAIRDDRAPTPLASLAVFVSMALCAIWLAASVWVYLVRRRRS